MFFLSRIWNSVSSRRLSREVRQELETHLALLEDAALREGLTVERAREQARRQFGSPAAHFENTRDTSVSTFFSEFIQDIRFAGRQMLKQPVFTGITVLVIALGISAVTTIFSLVNAVLVHSLPYRDPARLVYLWTPNSQFGDSVPNELGPNYPDLLDWQKSSRSFSSLAIVNQRLFNLVQGGGVVRAGGALVNAAFFRTLGVKTEFGRTFNTADEEPGHDHVIIISHYFWNVLFAGRADALGKAIQLGRDKYVVVGVMPREFGYPFDGDIPYVTPGFGRTNLWIPLALDRNSSVDRKFAKSADAAIARLRPETTLQEAQRELNAIEKRLDPLYPPEIRGWTVLITPLVDTIIGPVSKMLWLLLAAVGVVLLIAAANVANLLLAKSAERMHEIAVRASLGAGRLRLIRQMLNEALTLALAGCFLGILISFGAVRVLIRLNPGNIPRFEQTAVNWPVLLAALAISLLSGALFGLAPAVLASRSRLSESLGRGSNKGAIGGSTRLRQTLVATEVALSFVLLASAGLLIRSYLKLQAQNPGYLGSTLTMNLQLDERYSKPEQRRTVFLRFLDRIRQIPGVIYAGAGSDIPLDHYESIGVVEIKGYGKLKNMVDARAITPGYLAAFGMRLIAGRPFDDFDLKNPDRSVIVNESFANTFMKNRDPLAVPVRFASTGATTHPWATVIGVVTDRRHSTLEETPRPEYFQLYSPSYDTAGLHFAVHSRLAPARLAASARKILHEIDPALALDDVRTMNERMAEANARRRFQTILLSAFSFVAILLALSGIYGVLSYSVRQKTKEMGLRMAIGAGPLHIFLLVLKQGMGAVVFGLILGVAVALFLTRAISSWLYQVSSSDPVTYSLVPLLVIAVSSIACLVPAFEAIKVDPATTIRDE